MILKPSPTALGIVLLSSALLVDCGCNRSEPKPVASVESAVVEPAVDPSSVQGKVEVHGLPQSPRYDVTFDVTSDGFRGSARIERQEKVWPESFEIQILGGRYPIRWVVLNLDGFGPINLHHVPDKKWVNFYDECGNHLDQPIETAFRIETEETGESLGVKVTLPERARSMRGVTITYNTFSW